MKRIAVIGLIAALGFAVAGCGGDRAQRAASKSGVRHVHGLGIDPADGDLYAATHYGLFRVPATGAARRVGDNSQDTMGFTVVGPQHFLGSGHPDVQDRELPPLLGLIESTDAGRHWQPISLLGEADFHALSFRHGAVYGYDATKQRFMVSTDRRSWDTRSQPAGLISFAVAPNDPDHVLATTSSGLFSSGDGGRTWDRAAGPPPAILSWAEDGTLAAAAGDAGVYVSSDRGTTWSKLGELPALPEALLTVDGNTLVAAVEERGIYYSTDGGRTWRLRYRDKASQSS